MVPADFRGKRNKPEYLPSTCAFLAEIVELDAEEVSQGGLRKRLQVLQAARPRLELTQRSFTRRAQRGTERIPLWSPCEMTYGH